MDPLKEMFNKNFYLDFADVFAGEYKDFNTISFIKNVTKDLSQLSLNGRLRNTSMVLKKHLPDDYKKTIEIIFRVAPKLNTGYTALVLPDFVALYGKDHFDLSMEALKEFTVYGSSEFA